MPKTAVSYEGATVVWYIALSFNLHIAFAAAVKPQPKLTVAPTVAAVSAAASVCWCSATASPAHHGQHDYLPEPTSKVSLVVGSKTLVAYDTGALAAAGSRSTV